MANKEYLNYRLNQLKNEVPAIKKKIGWVENNLNALDAEVDNFVAKIDTLAAEIENYHISTHREYERQTKRLQNQISSLEKKLAKQGGKATSGVNPVILDKAKTIAIFDAILSAITSWSTSGDLASDVEAASQSVIFPSIYERIMSGTDPAYLLSDVPSTALVAVQRGREYVCWIRSECQTAITHPEAWLKYAPEVQKWWLNDGLPLIYGEADPDWEDDIPFSLDQIETWRNNPADRMTAFPKVYDAMEIYSKNRQEVMDTTNIRQFNLDTSKTRLS